MPPSHKGIENRNTHAAKPAINDSTNVIGLSTHMNVNLRNRSQVKTRTVSVMGKIKYTLMPQNEYASI